MSSYSPSLAGLRLAPDDRERVDGVVDSLREGVLQREADGGRPHEEITALRAAGLLVGPWSMASGPRIETWDAVLAATAELAAVDASAAFLLGYHHMHVQLLASSGNPAIAEWAAHGTAAEGWSWGGANNPSGARTVVTEVEGGYRLSGAKEFATGSLSADKLIIQESSPTEESPLRRIVLAVDAASPGLDIVADWDGIGVVRSATNRIVFDDVFVPAERFVKYSRVGNEHPLLVETASAPGFQIVFANVYLGIALGALRRSYDYLYGDGTGTPNKRLGLSHVQEIFGELVVAVGVARQSVERANESFARILSAGTGAVPQEEYRELARQVIETKVFVHETVLEVTQRVFEVTGSRGAMKGIGLDKFWRDSRNHSLHDELRVRQRYVGALALGVEPAS